MSSTPPRSSQIGPMVDDGRPFRAIGVVELWFHYKPLVGREVILDSKPQNSIGAIIGSSESVSMLIRTVALSGRSFFTSEQTPEIASRFDISWLRARPNGSWEGTSPAHVTSCTFVHMHLCYQLSGQKRYPYQTLNTIFICQYRMLSLLRLVHSLEMQHHFCMRTTISTLAQSILQDDRLLKPT